MKRFIIILLGTMAIFILSSTIVGASNDIVMEGEADTMIGLDFPSYGKAKINDQNQVVGYEGFNLGLGYSAKNYFDPLKKEEFNPYWGWGTVILIIPYGEIGGDYVFKPNEDGDFWTIGGSVGLPLGVGINVSYRF